jgi:hypothetical protein
MLTVQLHGRWKWEDISLKSAWEKAETLSEKQTKSKKDWGPGSSVRAPA